MFRWLEGEIIDKGFNEMTVNVSGVGYHVFCSPNTLSHFQNSEKASLWIHTSVKENAIDLYGFLSKEELSFFELLLTVNGVGPKSAAAIIGTSAIETIREGLSSGDSAYFSKVTGIGKKTAEKIMLALRDKIGVITTSTSHTEGSVAIDALTALGYSERDAREAVQKIKNKTNTEDIVREALKNLSQK